MTDANEMAAQRDRSPAFPVVSLEAAQPLAHGGHGRGKKACGGFDAAPFGAFDQPQAVVVGFGFISRIRAK